MLDETCRELAQNCGNENEETFDFVVLHLCNYICTQAIQQVSSDKSTQHSHQSQFSHSMSSEDGDNSLLSALQEYDPGSRPEFLAVVTFSVLTSLFDIHKGHIASIKSFTHPIIASQIVEDR